MILVSAGLHRKVEVAAAHLPVLRRKIAGLYRHFLDGVDTVLAKLLVDVPQRALRILALYPDRLAVTRQAIHHQHLVIAESDRRKKRRHSQRIADVSAWSRTGIAAPC